METTSFASSSSSSSSSPRAKRFDVFLSFRGEDTRNDFTAHLSLALRKIGLFSIFKDDYALQKGKDIGPELMKSIEDSQYAVIVLSENYATSSWCLKELAKIVNCMGDSGRIRTIFYHVNPSHVKNVISTDVKKQQESSFWKALEEHSKNPTHSKELESWRIALVKVANQFGYPVEAHTEEAIFIKEFVANISSEIGASTRTMEGLFGMTPRLKKLDSYVLDHSLDSDNVCFLGIHGMGGIGKSTLAKAYYNKMSHKFDGRSFLENVREVCEKNANGLVHLQKQLLKDILGEDFQIGHAGEGIDLIRSRLCAKKVLIILDDVNDLEQLEALADSHRKKQGSENELDIWFGSGSVIIVTTRNKNSLKERYEICRAQQFDDNEALQLFSWKAFESIEPPDEFKKLAKEVVKYASYLPLALTVLGSLLRRKEKSEWESALCRLKNCPEKKIIEKLKISFDDLDKVDQAIFLDIACFFIGCGKDKVIEILDSCGFASKYGIRNLIDKSLLSIDTYGKIWMHDLLQEMGKDMGRQSRIWDKDQLNEILENREGTDQVEAIVVCHETKEYIFEAFSSMKKLRLLQIESDVPKYADPILVIVVGCLPCFEWLDDCHGPELSNNLQYLSWKGFPYNKLSSSFQPLKLVQLKLQNSNIIRLWNKGIKPLYCLKVLDLSYSQSFTKFSNFKVVPNLETLILSYCRELSEIHPSIIDLKKLILLNLKGCTRLKMLPKEINGLVSLKTFNLAYCLDNLWKSHSHLFGDGDGDGDGLELPNNLQYLNLRGFPHHKLSSGFQPLELVELKLSSSNIKKLWDNCMKTPLYNLKVLDLSYSEYFFEFDDFTVVPNLEELNLSRCIGLFKIHPSIKHLKKLIRLNLDHCLSLENLPEEINGLASLQRLSLCFCNCLKKLPDDLEQLKSLTDLHIQYTRIKQLPSSIILLENLEFVDCNGEKVKESAARDYIISFSTTGKCFPPRWIWTSIKRLDLSCCNLTGPEAFPEYFFKLDRLEELDLSKNPFSILPAGFKGFTNLKTLRLEHCESLRCLESELLPSSLEVINVNYCISLASFLDPLKPCHLRCSEIYCLDCTELVKRQDAKMTALASLSRFLEDRHYSEYRKFKFIVPQSENELPSWFINQSRTASVTIDLNPKRYSRRITGFAMVFCFRANPSTEDNFRCKITARSIEDRNITNQLDLGVVNRRMSDHLYLLYSNMSLHPMFFRRTIFSFLRASFPQRKNKKFLRASGSCGVRLVSEKDKEELKEITSKYVNAQKDMESSHSHSRQLEE